MAFPKAHEIHKRRFGRNVGLGVVLGLFVALVFGLTVVKVNNGDTMKAFDHVPDAVTVPPSGRLAGVVARVRVGLWLRGPAAAITSIRGVVIVPAPET